MADLDPRKQMILQAVVFEYVNAAEPVGSEMLVQKYQLGVKSATVRNEMADLSEMGYLEQPHTSAGRIPSDQGYRYYVDKLIVNRSLKPEAKQRVKDAAEEGDALQELLAETTRALSRLTHLLTASTVLQDSNVIVRNAMISALGPAQALLVVVMSNGNVENRMLEIPPGLTLEDLGQANEAISQALAGKSLRHVLRNKAPSVAGGNVEKLIAVVWGALRALAKDASRGAVTTEGEAYLLGQPEFRHEVATLTKMLEDFRESDVLLDALSTPSDQPQVVTIGRENKRKELHQLSVIRQSFFVGENEAGIIAVIGPTRMRYDTSIPLVDYTAKALSETLTKFFG